MRGSKSRQCLTFAVVLCTAACARAAYISEVYAGGDDATLSNAVEITFDASSPVSDTTTLKPVADGSHTLGLLVLTSQAGVGSRTVLSNDAIIPGADGTAALLSSTPWNAPIWATAPPDVQLASGLDLTDAGSPAWLAGRTLLLLDEPASLAVGKTFDPRTQTLPTVLDAITLGSKRYARAWAKEPIFNPAQGYAIERPTQWRHSANQPASFFLQGDPGQTGQLMGISPHYYLSPGFLNSTWTAATPWPWTASLLFPMAIVFLTGRRSCRGG